MIGPVEYPRALIDKELVRMRCKNNLLVGGRRRVYPGTESAVIKVNLEIHKTAQTYDPEGLARLTLKDVLRIEQRAQLLEEQSWVFPATPKVQVWRVP